MKVSIAAPHSIEQKQLLLDMAHHAENAKELLLVVRAAEGVFPTDNSSAEQKSFGAMVTDKMIGVATVDQLIDYAVQYPVDSEHGRRLADRIVELARQSNDPHVWYRVRAAAYHLGMSDLARQAQATADRLAAR